MKSDPFRYFRVEARELLQHLGRGVLELEKGAAPARLVQELLRHAHTLKGAARVVKQPAIATEAHAVEDALAPFRGGDVAAGRSDIDGILEHLDRITQLVSSIGAVDTVEPKQDAPPSEPAAMSELSATAGELDALLEGISEALVQLGALRRSLDTVDDASNAAGPVKTRRGRARRERAGAASEPDPSPALAVGASGMEPGRTRSLRSSLDQIEREMLGVRDAAVNLRLVPAGNLFGPLERIARDTARAVGKSVGFSARGGDLRLEGAVQKHVQDALVQVVRNAVAHGIEPTSERVLAGKPAEGRVMLEIVRRGDRVAFVCTDDGRGLDLAALRTLAESKGLLDASTTEVAAEQLIQLLLHGGLSTSKSVTEVAGRGVGLDVVRASTARVGGEVIVRSEASRGTTVEIVVPLTLSALDVLSVVADGREIALPLDCVRRSVRVAGDEIVRTAAAASIVQDGEIVPFAPLSRCLRLGADGEQAPKAWTTVIVSGGGSRAAIGVERIVGTSRIIARPIPSAARVDPVVSGLYLDVGGDPQLVLDPAALVQSAARTRETAQEQRAPTRLPILVVDDSMTTRMLEQSILESAGYEVDLATSGEDGLEKVARRRYGLILVDVEMPGMDGFTFVQRIRSDPALRAIPAILVTSRDSESDRHRGAQAGATAHISKGEFDQQEFLDRIRGLIG